MPQPLPLVMPLVPLVPVVTEPNGPRELGILSAVRSVNDAKDDIQAAIARATTWAELKQLYQICEDISRGFEHLSTTALRKADRL